MTIIFSEKFIDEYKYWLRSQPNITGKIDRLIDSIEINPYEGIGKPERLLGEDNNFWSRRITKKDRLIYSVKSPKTFTVGDNTFIYCAPTNNDEVILISCRGHYD